MVTIRLGGEARVQDADALEATLLRLTARRVPLVLLDLGELRFISTLAMRVLVDFWRSASRAGTQVRFAPAFQPEVRGALDRPDLVNLFGVWQGEPAVSANPSNGG
jgi:anti-anti-sigma factor